MALKDQIEKAVLQIGRAALQKKKTLAEKVINTKANAMAWLFYSDTTPTRSFLIGACIVWGTWVIGVDGFIPEVQSLATMYQMFRSANLIASIPISIAIFQVATIFFSRWMTVNLAKRLSVFSGVLMSAWWIFTAVSYWRSSPFLPSIGVYLTMSVFGLWVVWRDAIPKKLVKTEVV